ncbi:MAG TPA: hypothetical protein VM821_08055 [Abditibacteriaceae bacterium]|nr:hypothetical protein [Abditibacteriaceae bacterium]
MNVSLSGCFAPLTSLHQHSAHRRSASRKNVWLLLALGGAMGFDATNVGAAVSRGPVISPSVKQAHRLKFYPPRGWIRHYLGDDRYKIGTTWRVVTTPNDKFYYPPFAREMLMAPPGQIIGFASAQDAQEAGYAPAPAYGEAFGLDARQMATDDLRNSEEPSSGAAPRRNVTTINRTPRAQRIILADGRSSVLLPPNWKRVQSMQRTYNGVLAQADVLGPVSGRGGLAFATVTVPGMPRNADMGMFIKPSTFRQSLSRVNNSGRVNNQVTQAMNDVSIRSASLGGVSGVSLTPRRGLRLPTGSVGEIVMIGRGSKLYMMMNQGAGRLPGARTIVNSFRPR